MAQRPDERPVRTAALPAKILAALAALVVVTFAVSLFSRPAAAGESLAGELLVATPDLSDPNFSHTVIYLLRHDATGALGLVINRPMGAVPLERLLSVLEGDPEGAAGATGSAGAAENGGDSQGGSDLLVYYGGPVEPYRAFTLHSRDVMFDDSVPVDDETAYNVQGEILHALAEGDGPSRLIFLLGYSGWGAGQLESELERGDWYVVDADPKLVFSKTPSYTWERAVARFGTEL